MGVSLQVFHRVFLQLPRRMDCFSVTYTEDGTLCRGHLGRRSVVPAPSCLPHGAMSDMSVASALAIGRSDAEAPILWPPDGRS